MEVSSHVQRDEPACDDAAVTHGYGVGLVGLFVRLVLSGVSLRGVSRALQILVPAAGLSWGCPHWTSVERLEEKLGWLREFRVALSEWTEWQELVEAAVQFVNRQGLYRGAADDLTRSLPSALLHPSGARLAGELREFVAAQSSQARLGERLPGSTEVLESCFGKFKALITLKSPAAVRQFRLTPGNLRSGEQTVKLWMRAVVPPSPARKSLVFQISPPQPQGTVQIHAPDPVEVVVSGPPPVQLVLTDGKRVPGTFVAVIPDDATRARIRVVPAILGVRKRGEAHGLVATPGSLPPIEIEGSPRIPLFTSGELSVKPAVSVRRSFFADTFVQGELTVSPAPLSDAVKGSRHGVLLRMEAPFKRLLFYLAVSISAILAAYLLFRLYMRLRTVESSDVAAGGDQ